MANKSASKKSIRQSNKRRLANKSVRSSVQTRAKQALDAISKGDAEGAAKSIRAFEKLGARAGQRNIMSSFAVSRKVSRLTAKLKALVGRK